MTDCLLAAGRAHENSSHGFGRRGEKVAAMVPTVYRLISNQAKVGLVDQRGRFQRLPRLRVGQTQSSQPAQLVVHQWQQLSSGVRITCLDGVNDVGDFGHNARADLLLRNSPYIQPGMVQKRPFSGNTGLSARTLIGPALERVGARSWLPCWGLQLRANRVYPRSSSQ
jgi:hypothetical protein